MASHLSNMYRFIVQYYDLEALRALCANLGVAFDDLGGKGREAKAWQLVMQIGRRRQLSQLLATLYQNHPDLFDREGLGRTQAVADTLSGVYRFSGLEK